MSHAMPPPSARPLARWAPAAVVFGLFFAYSAVQAPVPGVNEPQYLGKSKHFWDPTWAAGDFFLDSSNPHLVFYVAVGWLTQFLSLDATAWIARAAGYALLAVGWTMLAGRVAGSRWAAVPSAAVFLLLASIGNFSGEWLVGGIEGKVFSYALLFAGIAFWLDGRSTAAAACVGGAVSFHPVVGAWGVVCGIAAESATWLTTSKPAGCGRRGRIAPVAAFLLTALPGLIPAALTLGGADPQDAARATYMQVFVRLRHHLDPTRFGWEHYAGYAFLVAAWLGVRFLSRPNSETTERSDRWFTRFVLASVVIAIAGVAIGWHGDSAWTMPLRDLRGTLLKFYPFRMADVLVPLAFSLMVAGWLLGERQASACRYMPSRERLQRADVTQTTPLTPNPSPQGEGDRNRGQQEAFGRTGRLTPAARLAVVTLVSIVAFVVALSIPSPDRNPSRMPPERLADWIDVARWVRERTPPGSVVVAPSRQWGFKWFAHRAEFVNFKDAPQDAAGLLEWERRLGVIRRWWESSPTGRFGESDLRRLGNRTGADHLVTLADADRFGTTPLYDNGTYRVYALAE